MTSSIFFSELPTPLELSVCTRLTDLFLDTDISLISCHARRLARLPIRINQISTLLWFDVHPIFVWHVFAWNWCGWDKDEVKELIEGISD